MSICCSQPPADPNYTICFPNSQAVEGFSNDQANPFYDFANQISVWTYSLQVDNGGPLTPNVSHWGFQVCPDLACDARAGGVSNFFKVERAQEISPGVLGPFTDITNIVEAFCSSPVEPTSGLPFFIKINLGQNKGTTFFYRITIKSPNYFDLAATQVGTLSIKAGNNILNFTQATCGANLPPTPDFQCGRVPVPTLSITKTCPTPPQGRDAFVVGDTITIPIAVGNAGLSTVTGTVGDVLQLPAGVTISGFTTNPVATTIVPAPGPGGTFTGLVQITTTWANQSLSPGTNNFTISFTIDAAPAEGATITNLQGSVITETTTIITESCSIPVREEVPPPTRGVSFLDLKIV